MSIAFAISIVIHLGLIYTIPSAKLFSEGIDGASPGEMILVDMIQDQDKGIELETPPSENVDNQFQVALPEEIPQPSDQPENESLAKTPPEPDDIEMLAPPKTEPPTLDTDYMLLARADTREPEFDQLQKRSLVEPEHSIRPHLPEQQDQEKFMAKPERPQPPEIQPAMPLEQPAEFKGKVSLVPARKETNATEKPEENMLFPLRIGPKTERQPALEDIPEKRVGFGTNLAKEIDRQTPFSPSSFDIKSETSQKRQLGFAKETKEDKSRFGIFAGRDLEPPPMKETVQEVALAEEKTEKTPQENLELAKQLKVSSQIEGPIKGRKIVFQPPLPQVDVGIDVEFRLKFWVLPDGTIGEVIPLKRGDVNLERVAIAYLKKWQFQPLPSHLPQQKIWGTIPIRFTVQ
jgi:TonB family protein